MIPSLPDTSQEIQLLERTWADPAGVSGWLCHVDHKSIGRRYIATAFGFFLMAGLLALVMRLQLSRPENHFLDPDLYNEIFTMHGTTMMFLFAVPVMQGLGIYFVPLMVGARSIAFPRLVAFSYWMFLFGGIFLFTAFALNAGPDVGWFSYPPLAGAEYSPTKRADVWAQLITFTEVASLAVAVSLITTAFKLRTPGMALNRIPAFVWAEIVTSFMVIFAMPAVMIASTALILDRLVHTHFFDSARGGDPLLWQHLFWFFGHPEVYIIFIPGAGLVSTIVPVAARRPLMGYVVVVLSLAATAFMGFGLWVHHMFATGLPQLGESFFTAASIMIAIPSGAQVFCWIATMWSGRVSLTTPMLWVLGFFFIFIMGGMTGLMLGSTALDLQLHDTFFVVAHLHYVLIGGAVFPLFGAFYHWFPKITGRMLSDRLGALSFWLFFIGFNTTFFPMHVLGFRGMPRRIYTYAPDLGWDTLNLVASLGVIAITLGVLVFLLDAAISLRRGVLAGANPWNAGTLEWATSSPPPAYNFAHQPLVASREPLWLDAAERPEVQGLRADIREVLVTYVVDALPDHRLHFPGPSIWPFLTAIATSVLFVWSIFTPWGVVYGAGPLFVTLTGWFWPKSGEAGTQEAPVSRPTLAHTEAHAKGAA